ncbi:MAG: hypothetical protein PVJ34_06090 [Anaerolineae bacterium]|jgi:uncharacterized OsmC-like protein
MILTMAAVAAHKGIDCARMAATVEGRTVLAGRETRTRFVSRLSLGEGLSGREVRILYNAARSCEVHKMLRGEIEFEEHLETKDGYR